LPSAERFEGAEAAGRVQPTEQVGGDFYQLFQLPEGRIGVMLGDVSLHGFPSALIMTLTMSAAGIYARESSSPARVLRQLDDALHEELASTEMYLTLFYGVIDPAAGELVYSNAGHPHAFAVHPDGTYDRLAATDPPVGFAGPDSFEERRLPWRRDGDLLCLFTDGLPDTLPRVQGKKPEDLVLDTVVRHRFSTPEEIISALFGIPQDRTSNRVGDDRTALVLRL
jgi:sigma-B regulation protein RsbU (phosphoserine phosphatase)